jgi:nucleoid-associated protein YgaU
VYYTVEDGDTLPKIAQKFYGDCNKWKQIYDFNLDVVVLLRGTTLFIPIMGVQYKS